MADQKMIESADTKREKRIPPGQTQITDMPVLHYGNVHYLDKSKWVLTIFGHVDKTCKLSYNEFISLPMIKVHSDIHCVTGWSKIDNVWQGVSTRELKRLVNVLSSAKFVIIHCAGNFTTNVHIDDFFADDAILALKHNDESITPEHGAPVRLVIPRLYFWKSAKWVTGIEFTDLDRPGFWESHGYHNHGDPWKEERYS